MSAQIIDFPRPFKPRPVSRPMTSAEQYFTRIYVGDGYSQDEAERRAHELAMNMLGRRKFGAGEV